MKQWHKNHPNYSKQYHEKNRKKINEHRRQYYQEHKEKIKKYNCEKQKKYYKKHRGRILKRNNNRRKKVKQYINNYKLSKGCEACGYNKCAEALIFHHNKDKNKKFDISRLTRSGGSLEKIKNEIKKCKVLCSNCHAELHEKLRKKEAKKIENQNRGDVKSE